MVIVVAMIGNLRKMGQLADRLSDLASIPSRASRAIANRITGLLDQQFDDGVDPYGAPWQELAAATAERHGPPPLTETGEMREGTYAKPMPGSGIALYGGSSSRSWNGTVAVAGIHQTGAHKEGWDMPARPILPQGRALPDEWKSAIDDELAAAFSKAKR